MTRNATDLDRIAQAGQRHAHAVIGGETIEDRLAFAIMLKTRSGAAAI